MQESSKEIGRCVCMKKASKELASVYARKVART